MAKGSFMTSPARGAQDPVTADGELPRIDPKQDAILLDVDGTLLDIAATPLAVHVPESLRQALERLTEQSSGAMALVSGRTLEALDQLFAPSRFAAAGCHGAELRRSPHGDRELHASPMPESLQRALNEVARLESQIRVEDKVFTQAFHFRGAREREASLQRLLDERVAPFARDYVLLHGKSVFEVRPRACNKGQAVRALMREPPFAGRRPVFFGDDKTDEDAFAVLPEFGGLGVAVGCRAPNAGFMVHTPREVRLWLKSLAWPAGEPDR